MSIVVAALIGYLMGAIPFGLIIGRLAKGVDLREHGSHRTGATNALRTLGAKAAALIFALDIAKGVAAVLIARALAGEQADWAAAVAGFAAVVGHNWSVFIRFTGGRGVATSVGAIGAISPWTLVVISPVVWLVMWRWRYVSLGSLVGALIMPIVTIGWFLVGQANAPAIAYAVCASALVAFAHADNIARLRAGTERKIGHREAADPNA